MGNTIVLIGTLDTKGPETEFARDLISKRGHDPLVIDCGMMGDVYFSPDITRDEVADAAGYGLDDIRSMSKSDAVTAMSNGLIRIVKQLLAEGKIHGILGLGGGQGTVMATGIMKELPFGFPKVMVSAVANGGQSFGPFIGTKDICIIHSVADVLGLNVITRQVIAEGVGAVTGMVETTIDDVEPAGITIGLTSAGVTTPCAMKLKELLEVEGYEVIAFHCNGIGAEAMEELAAEGKIQGIIDMSPKDIGDSLFGGIFPSYPDRLKKLRDHGVPLVFIPGTLDFILYGAFETVSPELKKRLHIRHNPLHTHVRSTREEMAEMGREIGSRLSGYRRTVRVLIPEKGFTKTGRPGGPINDPESDKGFREGLESWLAENQGEKIEISSLPYNINDPEFAEAAVEAMKMSLKDYQTAGNEEQDCS